MYKPYKSPSNNIQPHFICASPTQSFSFISLFLCSSDTLSHGEEEQGPAKDRDGEDAKRQ